MGLCAGPSPHRTAPSRTRRAGGAGPRRFFAELRTHAAGRAKAGRVPSEGRSGPRRYRGGAAAARSRAPWTQRPRRSAARHVGAPGSGRGSGRVGHSPPAAAAPTGVGRDGGHRGNAWGWGLPGPPASDELHGRLCPTGSVPGGSKLVPLPSPPSSLRVSHPARVPRPPLASRHPFWASRGLPPRGAHSPGRHSPAAGPPAPGDPLDGLARAAQTLRPGKTCFPRGPRGLQLLANG